MKNKISVPLSIIIVVGVAITAFLLADFLNANQIDILSRASGDNEPKEFLVSDVGHESVVVNWYTTKPTDGFVKVFNGANQVATVLDDANSNYHRILVEGLEIGTSHRVVVVSDAEEFGSLLGSTFQTADKEITSSSYPIYGQIFDKDGISFLKEGIVLIKLDNGEESQIYTTLLNEAGGYLFNFENLKYLSLEKEYDRDKPGSATLEIYTSDAGKVTKTIPYDFTKSRQLTNLVAGDTDLDLIPSIDGVLEDE